MINRILELKKPLCTILPELEEIDSWSTSEWKILKEFVVVLDIFEASTRVLCGNSYSTLLMFIPTVSLLIETIKPTSNDKFTVNNIDIKQPAVIAFTEHLVHCVHCVHKFALLATLLDPRFKKSNYENNLFSDFFYSLLFQITLAR